MKTFVHAHATHPQWRMAAALVLAQLRAQMTLPGFVSEPTLALLYITDHYADAAQELLAFLRAELPQVTDWVGTVGVGIAANNVEYFDEPALALMLCELPADQYRVFSGIAPLAGSFEAQAALVHADGATPELAELLTELASRTRGHYLFGGLSSSRGRSYQFAAGGDGFMRGQGLASGVFEGGLSGVAFGPHVALLSRVTQGCQPVAASHRVTEADRNVVYALDGEPALAVLLRDLGLQQPFDESALDRVRSTLAGLMRADTATTPAPASSRVAVRPTGNFGTEVLVRHIIGLDPARQGVAVADLLEPGMQLAFCQRHVQAARADLIRICTEIREELSPELLLADPDAGTGLATAMQAAPVERRMVGAVYVSCAGRGGPHFGAPSAELQIVRRALGDVPLVGFFAGGEIAHHQLYGYTGVLTVFLAE